MVDTSLLCRDATRTRRYANETLRERLRSAKADATRTVQVVNGGWFAQ